MPWMSAPSSPRWQGQLWLAKDFALLHGQGASTSLHAHHAHQVLLCPGADGVEQAVTVNMRGVVSTSSCVLIPSLCPHAILQAPATLFTLYAEPTAMSAEALLDAVRHSAPTAHDLIRSVAHCRQTWPGDARVERALAEVDAQLGGSVSAATLARSVHLSLSQLERLFGEHLGLPVRRLVLWRRLRLAIFLVSAGHTLTQAAHEAGFADSAHFSRTMRAMLGVRADHSLRHLEIHRIGH